MSRRSLANPRHLAHLLYHALRKVLVEPPVDRWLRARLRRQTRERGPSVFVKVGANDGLTGDPCRDLLRRDTRWSGLFVEPVPYCVERLRENYPDERRFKIAPVAIGNAAGAKPFYYVSADAAQAMPDLPTWHDQLGSFDRQNILDHLDGRLAPHVVEAEVEVQTLTGVIRRAGLGRVDFLHVDTEGFDLEVMRTLDLAAYRPATVFVEHSKLSDADAESLRRLLVDNGYEVERGGSDYLATLPE